MISIYIVGIVIAIPLLLYMARCADDEWFGRGTCMLVFSLYSWLVVIPITLLIIWAVIKAAKNMYKNRNCYNKNSNKEWI